MKVYMMSHERVSSWWVFFTERQLNNCALHLFWVSYRNKTATLHSSGLTMMMLFLHKLLIYFICMSAAK